MTTPPRNRKGFPYRKWEEGLSRSVTNLAVDLANYPFVLMAVSGVLTAARALTGSSSITVTDGGAGSSATLAVASSGVTPGSYVSANITVGADGRVTAASSGASTGGLSLARWMLF